MLSGALVSGVQMAVSMSNTGGAWDNAKKYIEAVSRKDTFLLVHYCWCPGKVAVSWQGATWDNAQKYIAAVSRRLGCGAWMCRPVFECIVWSGLVWSADAAQRRGCIRARSDLP